MRIIMKGKITEFNAKSGTGKIETAAGNIFEFDMRSWIGYNIIPEVDMRVIFDISGKKLYNIEPFEEISIHTYQESEISTQDNKREIKLTELLEDEEEEDEESIFKKFCSNPTYEASDVKSSIYNYFHKVVEESVANREYLKYRNSLDYIKIRRFLMSAYNNLIEIDCRLQNAELIDFKRDIERIYNLYINFKKVTSYTKSAYNIIFLSRHPEQKKLQAKLEENREKISILNTEVQKLEALINEKNIKLSSLSKESDSYIQLYKRVKSLKKKLVDNIHEIASLTDENREYSKKIQEFYNRYYNEFKNCLNSFVDEYEYKLKKIMDVLAFQFNKTIWDKANHSELILDYFEKADLNGDFSALTYLKYYLRAIDESKANSKHKELFELQEYLEKQKKRTILCFDSDPAFLSVAKKIMVKIDNNIDVVLSSRRDIAIKYIKKYLPHILIVNPNIKEIDIVKFVKSIRDFMPDIEISFFADKIEKELLLLAKELHISAIIQKTTKKDELFKQIEKFLK